jgi:hypothetical protein
VTIAQAAGVLFGLTGLALTVRPPRSVEAQGTGTVAGVVTTTAAPPNPLRITTDVNVCGAQLPDEAIVVGEGGRVANAVLVLAGVKARGRPAEPLIVNEKCRFAPRVQIALPNAQVRTTSKDPLLHTTNATQEGGRNLFNVGLPIPGLTVQRPINGAGVVRLSCNTHSWMRGWLYVTDELAVVTGADGSFTLPDVPAGTYELRAWHEALKAAPQRVTVTAGGRAEANVVLAP